MSGPVRTCVGCRRRAPRAELVRLAVVEDRVVPDVRCRLPGRGAWLHPVASCVESARLTRRLSRTLRRTVEPTPDEWAAIERACDTRAHGAPTDE